MKRLLLILALSLASALAAARPARAQACPESFSNPAGIANCGSSSPACQYAKDTFCLANWYGNYQCGAGYSSVVPLVYSHYHLGWDGFCYDLKSTDRCPFGQPVNGVCRNITNPQTMPRFLNGHDGAEILQFKITAGPQRTGEWLNFQPYYLKVIGNVPAQIWCQASDGSDWYGWSYLPPSPYAYNISGLPQSRACHLHTADGYGAPATFSQIIVYNN